MVMGGDSCSEGWGFKFQHRILDGHFFTLICCKTVLMFVSKRRKINEKEAGDGPFLASNFFIPTNVIDANLSSLRFIFV